MINLKEDIDLFLMVIGIILMSISYYMHVLRTGRGWPTPFVLLDYSKREMIIFILGILFGIIGALI
jgi:hypothetical protein